MPATRRALPFQGMQRDAWVRLACAALAACYLLQLGLEVYWHNTCGHLAIDYCALRSAGQVARTSGFANVYDLAALGRVEREVTPRTTAPFVVSPIAYLPIFVVPLQLLPSLDPTTGYWLWTAINLGVLVLYLLFFIRQTTGSRPSAALLGLCLLSLPVYWNLFDGQVNVWLLISVGEVIRASLGGRPFRAGLWLGGLLLKPQLLLLVIPVLLFQRAFKLLAGLAVSSFALLASSWLLIGDGGMGRLASLWVGFGNGLPTNDVGMMMNWRMLGALLGTLWSPLLAWIAIAAGLIATLVTALYLCRRIDFQSEDSVVIWLGLWAATLLFAWHSHVHMSLILLPPLMYLSVTKRLSCAALTLWVLLPAFLYFAAFVAAGLLRAGLLPAGSAPWLDFTRGAGAFAMSIFLLLWAVRRTRAASPERSADPPQLTGHVA